MKTFWVIAATVVLGWAVMAQAGPLEIKDVPANAKWVAHADLDAAHSSQVVQSFVQQCSKDFPRAKEKVIEFCHRIGLEQCPDLHGVTLYGTKLEPHQGVLIARGKWNAHALLQKVEKAPHHKTLEYGKYTIHTWTHYAWSHEHGWAAHEHPWHRWYDWRHWHGWSGHHSHWHTWASYKHSTHGHLVAGAFVKPDVLILASSPDLVKSALDVIDGKAANLAGTASPLAKKVPRGTIFLVRAIDLKDSAAAKMHPALQLVKSFSYEKGEHDGRYFGNVAVTADSTPVAENLGKVFAGYEAWLSLHAHNAPWFLDLLDKVKLNVAGDVVTASFQEPASTVVAVMPKLCQTIQEHLKIFAAMRQAHGAEVMGSPHKTHEEWAKGPAKAHSPASVPTKKTSAGSTTSGGGTKK